MAFIAVMMLLCMTTSTLESSDTLLRSSDKNETAEETTNESLAVTVTEDKTMAIYLNKTAVSNQTGSTWRKKPALKIGFLVPRVNQASGVILRAAFMLGLQTTRDQGLLSHYDVTHTYGGSECSDRTGMKTTVRMWQESRDLDAIIGDDCSVVCQPVALLAAAWNIPEVAYSCVSNALSDKKTYPTFSRSSNLYNSAVPILVHIAEVFNWRRLALITDLRDLFRSVAIETKDALESRGSQVIYYAVESTMNSNEVLENKVIRLQQLLSQLKNQVRVFLVMMYTDDVRNVLVLSRELGMLDGTYAFYGLDAGLDSRMLVGLKPELGDAVWQGWIRPLSLINLINEQSFKKELQKEWLHPDFKAAVTPTTSEVNAEAPKAGRVHDAVLAWAHGVNKTLTAGGRPDDGFTVTSNIFNLTFEGRTGEVHIDMTGNRLSNFKVEIWQDGSFVRIMEWKAVTGTLVKIYKPSLPNDWSGLLWPGNSTEPPGDMPHCGWKGELCIQEDHSRDNVVIIASVVTASLICVLLVGVFRTLQARNDARLKAAKSCVVPWSELEATLKTGNNAGFSRMTLKSAGSRENGEALHHSTIAKVRNITVEIVDLGQGHLSINDKNVLNDLKTMTAMKHENIRSFIGLCVDGPAICCLVEVTSRGSVQDVISSATNLTWDLKVSLLRDISYGMKFIHSTSIGFHGQLTSGCCMVDSRWTCKIDDFGLLYSRSILRKNNEIIKTHGLWMAPELLRLASLGKYTFQNDTVEVTSTKKKRADVYAFGIIMQEVIMQESPFATTESSAVDYSSQHIIERVVLCESPPYRPYLDPQICSNEWILLAKRCWHEDPSARPSFSDVVQIITATSGGKNSLVDNMIARLEAHTKNLEIIVSERTIELVDEKSKMEQLLLELLPKSVVASLTSGRQVAPESFDDATIFFSDMVGFTRISAAGTPMQVVEMLNSMYTLLDEVSSVYDVYKVATIGDAYFVASGIPIKNGDLHAAEICRMALSLLKSLGGFVIRHLPDETLKLRVGVHSGPVVAGVTGLKMPRYLLFGDTVDIASKMESTGESMRVHVSQSTAEKLAHSREFTLTLRGEVEVKGVGLIKTYWVE